eukprot:72832-Chlamydomonas_euryale.AAC.15
MPTVRVLCAAARAVRCRRCAVRMRIKGGAAATRAAPRKLDPQHERLLVERGLGRRSGLWGESASVDRVGPWLCPLLQRTCVGKLCWGGTSSVDRVGSWPCPLLQRTCVDKLCWGGGAAASVDRVASWPCPVLRGRVWVCCAELGRGTGAALAGPAGYLLELGDRGVGSQRMGMWAWRSCTV